MIAYARSDRHRNRNRVRLCLEQHERVVLPRHSVSKRKEDLVNSLHCVYFRKPRVSLAYLTAVKTDAPYSTLLMEASCLTFSVF